MPKWSHVLYAAAVILCSSITVIVATRITAGTIVVPDDIRIWVSIALLITAMFAVYGGFKAIGIELIVNENDQPGHKPHVQ